MKCVLLCAGYATRLYPLTATKPKALLDVAGKAILEHILNKVKNAGIYDIFLVTNELFALQFRDWNHKNGSSVSIVSDGTKSNDERLGALRDLKLVLDTVSGSDDILLIAGDNLFEFSLQNMLILFREKKKSVVALHDLGEPSKASRKFGIVILDSHHKIIDFEEKPAHPKSALAATCCYVLRKESIAQLSKYLKNPSGENPGDFIRWLAQREDVYGFPFTEAWFDVGSFESLDAARRHYEACT